MLLRIGIFLKRINFIISFFISSCLQKNPYLKITNSPSSNRKCVIGKPKPGSVQDERTHEDPFVGILSGILFVDDFITITVLDDYKREVKIEMVNGIWGDKDGCQIIG